MGLGRWSNGLAHYVERTARVETELVVRIGDARSTDGYVIRKQYRAKHFVGCVVPWDRSGILLAPLERENFVEDLLLRLFSPINVLEQ